ncbi:uncharacterized protein LOC108110045 [Drosophila eugracilis]|uniref:uncharacterized protein LOC108110045 n=1 Tax=Drosophila eugracilis TaxID=29029 RepID=UPI0007E631C2|nr:uncharacterized protein LOC108110045 [Drosophila eugracilis]
MPPFSTCSICNIRTRKVARDPITLKQIYVCPKCFKNNKHKKVQPVKEDNLDKAGNEKLCQNEHKKSPEKAMALTKNDECSSTKSKEIKKTEQNENGKLKEPAKTLPMAVKEEKVKKVTPPLMQIVIINNRKYVAISETADDA